MKKIGVMLLLIGMLTSMVGCNNTSVDTIANKNNEDKVSISSEDVKNNKSDTYIKLYTEMFEDIKDIYNKRNLKYSEENTNNENFDGVSLVYFSDTDAMIGEISYAKYEIGFNSENNANTLGAMVAEKVSVEEIKNNGYTIDGTIFEDFAKVMIKNSEYKNEVEEAVNSYFNGNGDDVIFLEYDGVDVNLQFYSDEVYYQIVMKP